MCQNNDYLFLNDYEIISNLRKNQFENFQKAVNLVCVLENRLFIWKQSDACLLTAELVPSDEILTKTEFFQILLLTDPPRFRVEGILINNLGDKIAIWGKYGIVVVVLPKRVPPQGHFEANDKKVVYCRCRSLEERYFRKNKLAVAKQLKWHPGSENDNHLVVLTGDNNLRIYEIEEASAILYRCHDIGSKFNPNLNEFAVDFDFGSFRLPKSRYSRDLDAVMTWKSIVWPIYVLKNTGELLLFESTLDGHLVIGKIPKFKGPLLIQPHDFEFMDSLNFCSIKCMKFDPNILILATTTGYVYHLICLGHEDEDQKSSKEEHLRIFEVLELNNGIGAMTSLNDSSNIDCDLQVVKLYLDESNKYRYFIVHQAGIHLITVHLINELNTFLDSNDDDTELMQPSIQSQSTIEHILCTSLNLSQEQNSIVGFAQVSIPTGFFVILEDSSVVSKPLLKSSPLPLIDFDKSVQIECESPLKQIMKEPFDAYIRKCLLSNVQSKTIFKINKNSNLTPHENYELLLRITKSFREEHFPKMFEIKVEIERRLKILAVLAEYQTKELVELDLRKKEAQLVAEKLAERYEDIAEKQNCLTTKVEKLLVLVSKKQPMSLKTDDRFKKLLENAEKNIVEFSQNLKRIKDQHEYQKSQIENWKENQTMDEEVLDAGQYESLEKHLFEINSKLQQNKNEINWLCEEI